MDDARETGGALSYEAVREGTELPPYSFPLTLRRLVMETAANRDFSPVHYDHDVARSLGHRAPFANTMLLQSLMETLIRQWAGLGARIRTLGFRMLRPNYLGETIQARGVVVGKHTEAGRGLVELEVWQETEEQGRTVSGSAVVELPLRDGDGHAS